MPSRSGLTHGVLASSEGLHNPWTAIDLSREDAMRIQSFVVRRRNQRGSRWWDRAALAVVALMIIAFAVVAVRNVRRHDALTRWRSSLELAAGNPSWPEWSTTWPALPEPRTRRHQTPQDLRGVYAYAATHAELLAKIPCFCGCAALGHRSVLNCFVAGFRADRTPMWTDHSFDCEMCVHIAREVMLMESQGLQAGQIQAAIDRQYAHGHDRTPTPVASHETGGPQ